MTVAGKFAYIQHSGVVRKYEALTPFDVETLVDTGETFNTGAFDGASHNCTFNLDGTKFYFGGDVNNKIYEFDVATVFGLDATFVQDAVTVGNLGQHAWNNDGTKLFFAHRATDSRVYEFHLATPFDLSTLTSPNKFVSHTDNNANAFAFNADGSKIYLAGDELKRIQVLSLPTPFDFGSSVDEGVAFNFPAANALRSILWNDDGTRLYMVSRGDHRIYQYDTPVAYDATQLTQVGFFTTSLELNPNGIEWSKEFAGGGPVGKILKWDPITASFVFCPVQNNAIQFNPVFGDIVFC